MSIVKQSPSYDKQTINTPNPIARFAHRVRAKNSVKIALKYLPKNGVVLDFGAGTGLFLHSLLKEAPSIQAIGVEPYLSSMFSEVNFIRDLQSVTTSVDLITAFEVCEHLYEPELADFIENARRMVRPSGKVIISVPIMYGLTVPLKEANRIYLFRRQSEYSFKEIIRSIFGGLVSRPENPRITHKGFDFRGLKRGLADHFVVEDETLSPFPMLPWYLNSQIFFVCSPAK